MTTILTSFIAALCLSLVLTPLAARLGKKWGAVDVPDARKIHSTVMPRTGGLAIFISFLVVMGLACIWETEVTRRLVVKEGALFFFAGAAIAFGIGFVDDFRRLHAGLKFLFHVAAATVAFMGGIKIAAFGIVTSFPLTVVTSYLLTVFWFVLLINAVNLADGMDGLAGGIVIFACVGIVILGVMREEYLSAMLFAALGGATLGFLWYNFNPASIFLGDGGSYFLGYSIAGLSIMSSAKAQMSAILLIPMLALGVPLFDTLLAPVRRFIEGKGVFSPDTGHIHHRLKELGLTTKRVVWVIYGITVCLCALAVFIVNLRDEEAGLFLILLGVGGVFFVRKLGYFEYVAADKLYGWFQDIADVTGLSHDRRSFLNVQMEIASARDLETLWADTVTGLKILRFDVGEMALCPNGSGAMGQRGEGERARPKAEKEQGLAARQTGPKTGADPGEMGPATGWVDRIGQGYEGRERRVGAGDRRVWVVDSWTLGFPDRRNVPPDWRKKDGDGGCEVCGKSDLTGTGWHSTWQREGFDLERDLCKECLLKLELPLLKEDGVFLGTLWLVKDLKREPVTHYTLRRIEYLRRTLISTLTKLQSPPKSKH